MRRAHSLEKILMLGKIEGENRRGRQRRKLLNSITHSMDMNLSQLQDIAEGRGAWHAAVHGQQKVRYDLVTEQQQQKYIYVSLLIHPTHPSHLGSMFVLYVCVSISALQMRSYRFCRVHIHGLIYKK